MRTKVYSVRLPNFIAAQFDAYVAEGATTAQAALLLAVQELLAVRPPAPSPVDECAVCNRPLTPGQHVISKDWLWFDTLGCFNEYLTSAVRAVIQEEHQVSVPPDIRLQVRWADILDIATFADLDRSHFVVDKHNATYNLKHFTWEQGRQPQKCGSCLQPFKLADYHNRQLLVARSPRAYHHLNCLLPSAATLDNFRFAVHMALQTFCREVAEVVDFLPTITIDSDTIRLGAFSSVKGQR
jgi:hypothetical protein